MLRATIILLDRIVSQVVSILCLLLFLVCLYAMVDAANVYLNANDNSVLKYKPTLDQAPEVLRELSEDAVGWLTIDGTGIDYPVMQGENNLVYVNTDPYGEFSLSGSIFLDSRNSADFSDGYSMVYGHHLEHGLMFGALDRYYDEGYLKAHQTGVLLTNAGQEYQLTIFAVCKTLASEELLFDPPGTDREDILRYLEQNALFYEPGGCQPDCPVLALSTCQGYEDIDRLVVFCALDRVRL